MTAPGDTSFVGFAAWASKQSANLASWIELTAVPKQQPYTFAQLSIQAAVSKWPQAAVLGKFVNLS